MCLIGVLTLPMFHCGTNIIFSLGIMAAICCTGAIILLRQYKKLMQQPEVA